MRTKRGREWTHNIGQSENFPFPPNRGNPTEFKHKKRRKGGRDWSSLKEALLGSILGRRTSLQDFFACRRVCRNWRSIAIPDRRTMSSQSPLILTKTFFDVMHYRPYTTPPTVDHVLGYSHGHLILFRHSRIVLRNLFDGSEIQLPGGIFFLKTYRILLSSSPSSPDCLAISLPELVKSGLSQAVHYCAIGSRPQEWKLGLRDKNIMDMIFFKNTLYILNAEMQLGVLDRSSDTWKLQLLENTDYKVKFPGRDKSHPRWVLADSGTKLLKVPQTSLQLQEIRIWWWNFEQRGGWVKASNLDGRSLFIGEKGFGGSVFECQGSLLRRNNIYYAEKIAAWVTGFLRKFFPSLVKNPVTGSDRYNYDTELSVWILPSLL